MVFSVADMSYTLAESVGLFERGKLELFSHAGEILSSLPSFSSSTSFNVLNDVVVHLSELILAVVVELLVFKFKSSEFSVSNRSSLELGRHIGNFSKWY
jgi:hypothetical protein